MTNTQKPDQKLGRRPDMRCRRPEPGEVTPGPGTVVETAGGFVQVYVGDDWQQVDVPALAARIRPARRVQFVGIAARRVKAAVQNHWNDAADAASAARRAAQPPALPKAEPKRCGQPRTRGGACQMPAGARTDTPGEGPCSWHGGSIAKKAEAARRVVEQAATVARLATQARMRPLTLRERLEGTLALRDVLVAAQARQRRRRTP